MAESREFELGDLLSVATGILVARRHVDALYDLMGFMTGDVLFTHQLPRAMDACAPELIRQHPWLTDVEIPDWSNIPRDQVKGAVFTWLDEVEAAHGRLHHVRAACPGWQSKDPIAELDQMAGTRPVHVVRISVGEVDQ